PLAAAATVTAVVVGLLTVGRSSSSRPVAAPSSTASLSTRPSPSSTTSIPANPHATDAAARMWAAFPVHAQPRPVVLLGPQTDGPEGGFGNTDDKLAFMEGQANWPSSIQESAPAGPPTTANYPLLTARQAFALLPHATNNPPTLVTLQVTAVSLTMHDFYTDHGSQPLPAWEFRLDRVTNPVYVLAVAAAGRYPKQLADGSFMLRPAILSTDGRTVTIQFTSHQAAGPCQGGSEQVLDVAQTPTAVVLAVTVTRTVPAVKSTYACSDVALIPPRTPHAVTLDQALGARVVVDGTGQPYQVIGSAR
nr:hypothetical protein [Actinomycetota bacterium]